MKKLKLFLKNHKFLTYTFCLITVFTVTFALTINACAEETSIVEPRSTTLYNGEYILQHTTTIPTTIGYFSIDVLFTDLGEGYQEGMAAPYGRITWDNGLRTLSIFTYPDYEEVVLYKNGEWLSHQAFSLYFIQPSTTISNNTYAERFLTLYKYTFLIPTYFNTMSDGYYYGLLDGYNSGYELGYDTGFETGTSISKPFANIVGDIFDGLDNFVIFGDFSILDIIKSVMGIFLAVWLLKLIAGG